MTELASFWRRMVLPALGGETMRPRWPMPMGLRMSITRIDRSPSLRSSLMRSEEHTSELQSLRHLVCRLLLEKKNRVRIVGAGLAGTEAAWQCARRGAEVELFEIRHLRRT